MTKNITRSLWTMFDGRGWVMNLVTGCSGIDAIALAAELIDIDLIGQIGGFEIGTKA
jgi:hypothetical protein